MERIEVVVVGVRVRRSDAILCEVVLCRKNRGKCGVNLGADLQLANVEKSCDSTDKFLGDIIFRSTSTLPSLFNVLLRWIYFLLTFVECFYDDGYGICNGWNVPSMSRRKTALPPRAQMIVESGLRLFKAAG